MICGKCGDPKLETEFALKSAKTGRRHTTCRECKRKYNIGWYAENKQKHKSAVRAGNKVRRKKAIALVNRLRRQPCADCTHRFPPYCMDFDHRDNELKLGNVTDIARSWRSLKALLLEIEKCDVVCAVCHRKRTHRRELRARRKS